MKAFTKLLLILALVLCVTVAFVACRNDDDLGEGTETTEAVEGSTPAGDDGDDDDDPWAPSKDEKAARGMNTEGEKKKFDLEDLDF